MPSPRCTTRRLQRAARAGIAAAALLSAACGSDAATAPSADVERVAPTAHAPALDVALQATGAVSGQIVSAAGSGCLTGQSSAAALHVTPCVTGSAAQTWALPTVGTSGAVSMNAATYCTAAGGLNYWAMTLKCVPGDATQQWTPTAAGELRSPAGYCLTAVTSSGGTSVQLQLCTGSAAQRWSFPAPPATPTPPPTTGAVLIANAAGNGCIEVVGGATATNASVTVSPCVAGAPWQSWTIPAVGTKGLFKVYPALNMCLQSLGAAGTVGTPQSIYPCVATAPNHNWTLTASGELRGQNGLCVGITAATPSPKLTLQTCDGSAGQRWTTTPPAPAGTPPLTLPALAAKVTALMGVTPSVPAVEARGGPWTLYERDFRYWGDVHWASDGTYWENVNVYDRAMIYYVWWARTGNADYLTRANSYAVRYRTDYVEAQGYKPQPHYTMLDGIALHYLVTGDPKSLTAVGKVADNFATPAYLAALGSVTSGLDNRVQARVLTSILLAWYLKAPSAAGYEWAAALKAAAANIMASQGSDGAYRWTGQCGFNKPWMVGLVNDALIRYESFFPDARVVTSVKKAVDYMWAKDWNATAGAFVTLDGTCVNASLNETTTPVTEANMMVLDGFSYVARKTADQSYHAVADTVFTRAMNQLWFQGAKSWNQAYTSSYRYLQLRW